MFEIALQNGRIYDPESGKAEVASVGIQDGIIDTISSVPLPAIREINAEGLAEWLIDRLNGLNYLLRDYIMG